MTTRRWPYGFWPDFTPGAAWASAGRAYVTGAVQAMVIAAIMALPPVASAFGLPSARSVPLVVTYAVVLLCLAIWAATPVRTSARWRLAATMIALTSGLVACVGLPTATGNPASGLWACAVMYAAMNGSDQVYSGPSVAILLAHALTPLFAVPLFIHQGLSLSAAAGGPLLMAVLTAIAYHFCAQRTAIFQTALAERNTLREALLAADKKRERERLTQDLHDAVGSSLTLASMYADLLAHSADQPVLRQLAESLATTTRGGLGELRAALDGMRDEGIDAEQFGAALRAHAGLSDLGGLAITVTTLEGDAEIGPKSRTALLRIFQESLQNCVRHAGATTFTVTLNDEDSGCTVLLLEDDGCGFDSSSLRTHGRGLRHMRARAEELGGTLTIATNAGTRIRVQVPREATSN